MTIEQMTIVPFIQMLRAGAEALTSQAEMINALNVFPVPDGDTGTNMSLTIKSGVNYLNDQTPTNVGEASALFSKGLLMGARGNSGVILSQIFRGFSTGLSHVDVLTAENFAEALNTGVKSAFEAVMKPVEGTILTVVKDAARAGEKKAKRTNDLIQVMEAVLEESRASLKRTPELLPVLKEVGVVDSGGQGLVCVYQGFLQAMKGESINSDQVVMTGMEGLIHAEHHRHEQWDHHETDLTYGFCTEFMVRLAEPQSFDSSQLKMHLADAGDSMVVVSDDDLLKVHIHTEKPGDMLTLGQEYGELIKIKVDNMREQHANLKKSPDKVKKLHPMGIVTVAAGEGIKNLFLSSGADFCIQGGQTMNPSTEDLVNAIQKIHAQTVFILPNNSNIIMTANQAAEIANVKVVVIPTKSVMQGLAALLAYHPDKTVKDNTHRMNEGLQSVLSGQMTQAVRDTVIDEVQIQKDDYLGIIEGKIVVSKPGKNNAMKTLMSKMITDEHELVTVIFGQSVSEKERQNLKDWAEETFPEIDLECHDGGQPVYDYLISAE